MEIRQCLDVFWSTTKSEFFKCILCINTWKSRHSCEEIPMLWDLVIGSVYIRIIRVLLENLVSVIQLLKWLLINLNTEKLRSVSADVAGKVHHNTSKILMFGEISGSADTEDFIKISGKSTTYWTIWMHRYLLTSGLAGRHSFTG